MQTSAYITELSKCVRCGSCKAFCPTYDEDLTEPMGARGRLTLLRGLMTRQLKPSALLNDRIFSCILCGTCENLCPLQIGITEAIYHGRRLLSPSDRSRRYLRMLVNFSIQRPMLSYRIARAMRYMGLSLQRISAILGTTPFNITIPDAPLRNEHQVYRPERKIGRVAVFTGCSINFLFPHLGASLINVLLHLGYEVVLPMGEVCCGAPLRSLGLEGKAIKMAERNHEVFSRLNAEAILSLCPTCILSIKLHYPRLIGKGLDNAMDISSFLIDRIETQPLYPIHGLKTVTFHDPCHLKYPLGIEREPRDLIRLTGVELVEAEGKGCCGFGGVFGLQFRDISMSLLKKRADAYLSTGAEAVITSCPGCMLQLSSGLKDRQVLHIIELLEEAACQPFKG